MKYISTRGQAPSLNFEDVLLTGLASDGGLYVPETLPQYSQDEIESWRGLPYHELAFKVIAPFVDGAISDDDLKQMLKETYGSFNHRSVAPLVQIDQDQWVMELFRGPTLAFKDFALQLLGRLLDKVLTKNDEKVVIIGATSGDTGSAAIEGCRHSDHVDIFIMHPHQRVSDVQRRQMTTVLEENVFNIALEGNFDDCQRILKQCFADQSFLKGRRLVAVNSINWARIVAQIVYYFHAALSVGGPLRPISFSVPTGNFGDIFAGYLAYKMGLPVDRLIIATNGNDILHRVMSNNDMSPQPLQHSLSPSMDIMVSSNFERLLFDLYQRDGAAIEALLGGQPSTSLDEGALARGKEKFDSYRVDDERTCEVIKQIWDENEYLLDPHSAIAVDAALHLGESLTSPVVSLATAHPAKFPEAVTQSGCPEPSLPSHMADLHSREERYDVLPNALAEVQAYVNARIGD